MNDLPSMIFDFSEAEMEEIKAFDPTTADLQGIAETLHRNLCAQNKLSKAGLSTNYMIKKSNGFRL